MSNNKKNCVQNVTVHTPDNPRLNPHADKINKLHAEHIKRRLNEARLADKQKSDIVNRIMQKIN